MSTDKFTIESCATCAVCGEELTITSASYKYGFDVAVAPCESCAQKTITDRKKLIDAIVAVQEEKLAGDEPEWSTLEYEMFNIADEITREIGGPDDESNTPE